MLGPAGRLAPPQCSGRHSTGIIALALLVLAGLMLFATSARAQTFPLLTGRVVDGAKVIPAEEAARLDQKLAALEQQTNRQLVVATVASLEGYDVSDYANRLFRTWQLGDKERNDGVLLLVAPTDRKVRIEVGYGMEGIITDGLSSIIIQQEVLPQFKAGNLPGGIEAGTDALIKQLTLPPEEAAKIVAKAKPKKQQGLPFGLIIWLIFFGFAFVLPMIRRARGSQSYQSSGLGQVVLWSVLNGMTSGRGGGGGSDWGGGGGGGFSGGGGSSGGGGASGGW